MKPTVAEDEFEDAEEENKFINEVCVKDKVLHYAVVELSRRSIRYGRENIARPCSFMYNVSTGRRTPHTCTI
jgi:hypothetical protein